MLKENLLEFFERDLSKLQEEIGLYKNETDLWIVKDGINNSAGNLCLHLIGNMNHFIGATLGESGYVRNRDAEFALKNVSRSALIDELEKTISVVNAVLNKLPETNLNKNFPLEKHGKIVKTDYMLLHLLTHLNYHLGQVNYHRRLIG